MQQLYKNEAPPQYGSHKVAYAYEADGEERPQELGTAELVAPGSVQRR